MAISLQSYMYVCISIRANKDYYYSSYTAMVYIFDFKIKRFYNLVLYLTWPYTVALLLVVLFTLSWNAVSTIA